MPPTDELGTMNVRPFGMDRDRRRHLVTALVHVLVLASALACQRRERREATGDVGNSFPVRPAPITTSDASVNAAQAELAEGHAWPASQIVMPVLRIPERRTPEALIVAARAASEWGAWPLVRAMLATEPWIDSRFGGEAHELLARSALARGEDTEAREEAEKALEIPTDPASHAFRTVLLARALDRLEIRDTTAITYRRAADELPLAREWLLLRAAGVTKDEGARQKLYAMVKSNAARSRVPYTEAQTLEKYGMLQAAANAYEKIGDTPSAYRLRLTDPDRAVRAGVRAGLLGYIQRDAHGDDLQRAIEVLDAAFPRLDPTTELLVARRAAEGGIPSRAVAGYSHVPAGLLTEMDVIARARALSVTGRPTEAASRIAATRFSAARAAEAEYVRGVALLRAGRTTAARASLRRVLNGHGTTAEATDALYWLADLESDAGRDSRARDLLQQACVRQPPGDYSDDACFRAGILGLALGDARRAAAAFDALPSQFESSPELTAALYWAGRAWERNGNTDSARHRWTSVLQREPLSYYAALAAKRLYNAKLSVSAGPIPRSATFQAAVARAAVLERLGMDTEEKYEYDAMEAEANSSPGVALSAGAALLDRGEASRAIRLGWKAITAARANRDSTGKVDERGYRLIYPVLHDSTLVARARANSLDPALVAAVIRQESSWNPRAVSRAGARGLMQIMPNVGKSIAASRGYPIWDPALLFVPEVSLDLGTTHLRAALASYNLPRALAAYNAGASRVQRWIRRPGAGDPELFVERIPFVETRDYVRIVMRNAEMYRALYQF
jgi:soluble lytic murein transglycosylase